MTLVAVVVKYNVLSLSRRVPADHQQDFCGGILEMHVFSARQSPVSNLLCETGVQQMHGKQAQKWFPHHGPHRASTVSVVVILLLLLFWLPSVFTSGVNTVGLVCTHNLLDPALTPRQSIAFGKCCSPPQ